MPADTPPDRRDGRWDVGSAARNEALGAIHQRYRHEVLDLGLPPDDRCLICDAFEHFRNEQACVLDGLEYHAPPWNLSGTLHQHSVHPVFTNGDVELDLAFMRAELARLAAVRPSLRAALRFLASKLDDPGFVDRGPPYARLSTTAMARMCEVARGLLEIHRFIAYAAWDPDAGELPLDQVSVTDEDVDLDAFLAEIDPDGAIEDMELRALADLDSDRPEHDTSGVQSR